MFRYLYLVIRYKGRYIQYKGRAYKVVKVNWNGTVTIYKPRAQERYRLVNVYPRKGKVALEKGEWL